MGLAACKMTSAVPVPTEEATPEVTEAPKAWAHVAAGGVQLGIRTPDGWQSISNDYGILLAEHADMVDAETPSGILIYIFVPDMREIDLASFDNQNLAWAVLDHVTQIPQYVGESTVTDTVPFLWGSHEAAYYLLSDEDGNRTLVLALVVPIVNKIVVCNISTSAGDAHRIRDLLPVVLASLTVNGETIDESALAVLPDPLVFPVHRRRDDHDSRDEPMRVSTQAP